MRRCFTIRPMFKNGVPPCQLNFLGWSGIEIMPLNYFLTLYPRDCFGETSATRIPCTRCLIVCSYAESKMRTLWPHGNCAIACCTNSALGQASAKALIYLRFRAPNPATPGNALPRSAARQLMILVPQPSACWRIRMSLPMPQCRRIIFRNKYLVIIAATFSAEPGSKPFY